MKKTFLVLAVSCFLMVSCGPKAGTTEPTATQTEQGCATECPSEKKEGCPSEKKGCNMTDEQKATIEKYKAFDTLTEEEQTTVLAEIKAMIDAKCQEMEAKCTEEMPEEHKAKHEEFKAKWATYETLDLAGKKELIDGVMNCKGKKGCGEKAEGCCNEGKGCKDSASCCKEGAETKGCKE